MAQLTVNGLVYHSSCYYGVPDKFTARPGLSGRIILIFKTEFVLERGEMRL